MHHAVDGCAVAFRNCPWGVFRPFTLFHALRLGDGYSRERARGRDANVLPTSHDDDDFLFSLMQQPMDSSQANCQLAHWS